MGDGFKRIKKLVRINNTLKGVLNSVAVMALVVAVFMLLSRRDIYKLNILVLAISAAVCGVITLTVSLLVYRKSDIKLAKDIDTELGLNEKAETMIAFKDCDGDVVTVQRIDADEKIKAHKKVKLTKKGSLKSALSCLVAVCLLAGSIFLIPEKVEAEEPEPEYDMTEYEAERLKNLIEYVERSSAVEGEKTDIVASLTALLDYLSDTVKESEKKNQVIETIVAVNRAVDKVNFLEDITSEAEEKKFPRVSKLALAFTDTRSMADPNLNTSGKFSVIIANLTPVRQDFSSLEAFVDLGNFANEIKATVASVKNNNIATANDNKLIEAITLFCDEIIDYCSGSQPVNDIVQEQIDKFFFATPPYDDAFADSLETFKIKGIYNALEQEGINLNVGMYVMNQLIEIFNIPTAMLPSDVAEDLENAKNNDKNYFYEKDDDQNMTDGGIGDGNLLLGSNDTIYYPELDKYVNYGEALAHYQNKIIDMIESGGISDEKLIDYYTNYFEYLFGSKTEE